MRDSNDININLNNLVELLKIIGIGIVGLAVVTVLSKVKLFAS